MLRRFAYRTNGEFDNQGCKKKNKKCKQKLSRTLLQIIRNNLNDFKQRKRAKSPPNKQNHYPGHR